MPAMLRLLFARLQAYATLNFILGGFFGWAIQELFAQLSSGQRWVGFISVVFFLSIAFAVVPQLEQTIRAWLAPTIPPMGEKPQPHRGLILLFSNETTALRAIEHHQAKLEHILCVVTEYMEEKFQRLRPQLVARGWQVHPELMEDAYSQAEAATAVHNCIAWAKTKQMQPADLICDVTGGTAIMSIGATLQCQREGVSVQFVTARQTERGPEPLHPVLIRFPDAIEPVTSA